MVVLEIDPNECNYLTVGEESFFLFRTCDERTMVCPDACPHRGGPLHMGKMNCQTRSLTCPWHETVIMERALTRRSVPAVAASGRVTAVFSVAPDTPVLRTKRRIFVNER